MKAIKEAIAWLKFFKDKKNTRLTTMIKIQSCIAELEALQQSKQCNTCSFYHSFTGVCANDKCPLCADFVDADFGCIYHEAKGAMR